MSNRSGITLMEVLISAFVLAVGLLGLASLLPVARYLMVDTSKYDRSNTLGRAAVNDFEARGYLQPGGSQPFPPTPLTLSGTSGLIWQQQWVVPMRCTNVTDAGSLGTPYQSLMRYEPVFGTYAFQFPIISVIPVPPVTLPPRHYYTMSSSYNGMGNAAAPPTPSSAPMPILPPPASVNQGPGGLSAMYALRPPFVFDPLAIAYPQNELLFGPTANTTLGATQFPPAVFGTGTLAAPSANAPYPVAAAGTGPMAVSGATSPVPQLFRVTAGSTLYGHLPGSAAQPPAIQPTPLPFGQAAKTFMTTDELVFDMSQGREIRPTTSLIAVPPGYPTFPNPTPGAAADSDGSFSYFATAAPEALQWDKGPDDCWGISGHDDNHDGNRNDTGEAGWLGSDDILLTGNSTNQSWNVAVTVVYNRQLALVPEAYQAGSVTSETPPPPERMVYASILSAPQPLVPITVNPAQYNLQQANAGLGGGDVVLRTPPAGTANVTANWLDVKPNEWLMLSAYPSRGYGTGAAGGPMSQYNTVPAQVAVAKWYRIVSAGEIIGDPVLGGWMRQVTLSGDDWPAYDMFDALAPGRLANTPNATGFQTAFATLVTGAVAVYEDTIEIGH